MYVNSLFSKINKETKIRIANYTNPLEIAERLYLGGLSISGVGREVYMLLDSNERFYQLPKYKIERIYQMLRACDRKPPKVYMFNYHIKNIGLIKDVSDDVVRIVNKEQSY